MLVCMYKRRMCSDNSSEENTSRFLPAVFLGLIVPQICFGTTHATYASSSTNVSGVISQNTTWTIENSPYIFIDEVTVARGVVLRIEPGVVLDFDLWRLRVNGTLRAKGNQTHRIFLHSYQEPLMHACLFCGISSGANVFAAIGEAKKK